MITSILQSTVNGFLKIGKTPTINDDCSIKSRAFFEELESVLSKNRDKTVILAMHHPLMSNGSHGGQFSRKTNFPIRAKIPLPVIHL
jgi:hypothetical protein